MPAVLIRDLRGMQLALGKAPDEFKDAIALVSPYRDGHVVLAALDFQSLLALSLEIEKALEEWPMPNVLTLPIL